MGTTLEVCLYSGICHLDPKVELSESDNSVLKEKLETLTEVLEKVPLQHLGPNQFLVVFHDDENYIYSQPGSVTKYQKDTQDFVSFKDTADVHAFLAESAKTAISKHYEDMLRLTEQEKI